GSHRHRIVFLLGDEVLPRQLVTAVGAAGGRGAGIRRGESASRYRIRGRADHQRARTAARSAVVTTTRVALVATEEAAIVARQVVAIDMLVGQHCLAAAPHLAEGRTHDGFGETARIGET